MLTNRQKMLLHRVPQALGVDDAQRRVIQRNVGGFHSAADTTASHEGFCAVMAFYEGRAGGTLDGFTAGYWQAAHQRNEAGGGHSTERLARRIRLLAAEMGWTLGDAEALLVSDHCSSGQAKRLDEAPAYWLSRLLDAMKAIAARQAGQGVRA